MRLIRENEDARKIAAATKKKENRAQEKEISKNIIQTGFRNTINILSRYIN